MALLTTAIRADILTEESSKVKGLGHLLIACPDAPPTELVRREPSSETRGPEGTLAVGCRVRVRNGFTRAHNRCPRYLRGRSGTILGRRLDGPIPDIEAHAGLRVAEAVYAVSFPAAELWGGSDGPGTVQADLYESYLECLS